MPAPRHRRGALAAPHGGSLPRRGGAPPGKALPFLSEKDWLYGLAYMGDCYQAGAECCQVSVGVPQPPLHGADYEGQPCGH